MAPDPRDLLPLAPQDFHVLIALAEAPRHAYGLVKAVEALPDGGVRLEIGSLYRMLARLTTAGLIEDVELDRGSAPDPGSVARGGPNAPRRSVQPQRAKAARWGPRFAGRAVRGLPVMRQGKRVQSPGFGLHNGPTASAGGHEARRRYYRITPFGRKVAEAESSRLQAVLRMAKRQRLVGAKR